MNKFHKIPTGGGAPSRDWALCQRVGWPLWVEWLYTTAAQVISRLWLASIRETVRHGVPLSSGFNQALSSCGSFMDSSKVAAIPMGAWPCLGIHAQVLQIKTGITALFRSQKTALKYIITLLAAHIWIQTPQISGSTTSPSADPLKGGVA